MDKDQWPALKARLDRAVQDQDAATSGARSWSTPTCASRRCSRTSEAPQHPHNVARDTFVEVAGVTQPGPAPRFSRTPLEVQRPPAHAGQHTDEVLAEWGFDDARIAKLRETGAVA